MTQVKPKSKFFLGLEAGLKECIAFTKGEITLRTTELAAPPPKFAAKDVVRLRERMKLSQGLFASVLNVSPKAVQGWEQGLRRPSHATLRLLQIIDCNPDVVQSFVGGSVHTPHASNGKGKRRQRTRQGSAT